MAMKEQSLTPGSSLLVGSWRIENKDRTVHWSPEMFTIFERSRELGPPSYTEFLHLIHPGDKHKFANLWSSKDFDIFDFRVNAGSGCKTVLASVHSLDCNGAMVVGTMIEKKMETEPDPLSDLLIESMKDGFSAVDANGVHLKVNSSLCEMTGFSREELIGTGMPYPYWPEEEKREYRSVFARMEAGACQDYELILKRKAGELFPVLVSPASVRREDGTIIFFATIKDITKRKAQVDSVRISEERHRLFSEMACDYIYAVTVTPAREFLPDWETPGYQKVTGYSSDEVVRLGGWPSIVCKEDLKTIASQIESVQQGTPEILEYRIRRKDGEIRWLRDYARPRWSEQQGRIVSITGGVQDITETKEAEKALRESEEKLRSVLETVPGYIATLDAKGKILFINRTPSGVARDTSSGGSIFEYVLRKYHEKIRSAIRLVFDTGMVTETEIEGIGPFGDILWYEVRLGPFFNEDRVTCVVLSAFNITDRRIAEEALKESEQRFRTLVEQSPISIEIFSPDGTMVHVNKAWEKIWCRSREEVVDSYNPLTDPSVEKLGLKALIRRAFSGRSGQLPEVCYEPPDAPEMKRWLHTRYFPLKDLEGNVKNVVVFNEDITERKRVEESLKENQIFIEQILATSTSELYIYDVVENTSVFSNRKVSDALGFADEELRALGEPGLPSIMHEDDWQGFLRHLETMRSAKDGEIIDFEYRMRHGDGTWHWFHSRDAVFKRDEAGRVLLIIGTATDITQRKLAEEKVSRVNEELERRVMERTIELEAAVKELEAFSYSVSHDLRGPLRSINGYTQLLVETCEGSLDEDGRMCIERVLNASNRMAQLIDDLLKLSRLTREELHRQQIDLSNLTMEVAEELRGLQRNGNVIFRIDSGLRANADKRLLKVALENLISNSMKFAGVRPEPVITFGRLPDSSDDVFYVRDNGVGFDMTYANKLFAPFQRLHRPEEFEGTGIGLATVQRIIRRHGGRVWAEGKIGEGATFYFTLS